MSADNFDEALQRILADEGGYTNDPNDPGGPTNYGITIYDARMYWKRDATALDVRNMPIDAAKQIYRTRYWDAMRCDDLPDGLDYAVMDYGVNSGIGRPPRVLEKLMGLTVDGTFDDVLISRIAERDADYLIDKLCDERLAFLQSLRTWRYFGRGWGARVDRVRSVAHKMSAGRKTPPLQQNVSELEPNETTTFSAKALPPPSAGIISTIQDSKIAKAAIAGGGAAGSIGLNQIRDTLTQAKEVKDSAHNLGILDAIGVTLHHPAFWGGLILTVIAVAAACAIVWWRHVDHQIDH